MSPGTTLHGGWVSVRYADIAHTCRCLGPVLYLVRVVCTAAGFLYQPLALRGAFGETLGIHTLLVLR